MESETEPLLLPEFPDPIELTKSQVLSNALLSALTAEAAEAESRTYGEQLLRPGAGLPRLIITRKNWGRKLGASAPSSSAIQSGRKWPIEKEWVVQERDEVLRWVDARDPSSVLYLCFGSLCRFSSAQLDETPRGPLESSECRFIWVKKKGEVLPEGFEERNGKGNGTQSLGSSDPHP